MISLSAAAQPAPKIFSGKKNLFLLIFGALLMLFQTPGLSPTFLMKKPDRA